MLSSCLEWDEQLWGDDEFVLSVWVFLIALRAFMLGFLDDNFNFYDYE